MNYQTIFDTLASEMADVEDRGHVATYIEALSHVPPDRFGACLIDHQEAEYHLGDSNESFSIQSIAKVLSLTLAYRTAGESLWRRVGVEPSGNPFNSLVQLEYDGGIPRNPFINAGALVICDYLITEMPGVLDVILDLARRLSGNEQLVYSQEITESERVSGFRNAALVNLMKAFGNIHNDVEAVLDFYFKLCSIKMTCRDLARTFLYLMNNGLQPGLNERIVTKSQSKRINAVMQTCGFYDEAGEFTFRVGLPGKSGVGGGILAVHPQHYGIAVWSPRLNAKGNSYKGMLFLEAFTTRTGLSVF